MKKIYIVILFIGLLADPMFGYPGISSADSLNRNTLIKVDPFRLEVIPPSTGVQFYRNGLVFLSQTRAEGKMVQNQISFGKTDAYFAMYNDTTPGEHIIFSSSSVFDVPCDGMTFNNDFTVMYYTKKPSKNDPEKIFRAIYTTLKNGKHDWISDDEPLNFCLDNSSYTHPALSPDGKIMVFSSNRKDSEGGFDIYVTRADGSGWLLPVNAGKLINSTGDEFSPFLDNDNNLYFSSDGHKGFGGYDLFISRYDGSGWGEPANMSDKINTRYDELAFTINPDDGRSAFFTRRMSSGNQSLKLYRITFLNKTALNELTDLSNAFEYLAFGEFGKEIVPQANVASALITKESAGNDRNENPPLETKNPAMTGAGAITKESPKEEVKKFETPPAKSNTVVYRVQFATYSDPKGSYELNAGGNKYKTFEYLYGGYYRSCIGEFTSQSEAADLQKMLRQNGYKDAFVAAFKNDERYLGPIKEEYADNQADNKIALSAAGKAEQQPVVSVNPAPAEQAGKNDVVFRVQFASSSEPRGSFDMRVRGTNYQTFEYLYNGLYRSCIGEFSSPSQAAILQQALKLEGFSDAFVVAFRNNKRSLDPALFRQ
jgi:hypothetical protein